MLAGNIQHRQENKSPTHKSENKTEYVLKFPTGDVKLEISSGNKFTFFDNNVLVGSYTIDNIISYLSGSLTDSKLIEMTLVKINNGDIQIIKTSPLVSELDILILLNKLLKKISSNNPNVVKFTYKLIEHTLSVIAHISQQENISEELKNKLVRYSIGLMYGLTQFLNYNMTQINEKYSKMLSSLEQLKQVEEKLEQKLINMK